MVKSEPKKKPQSGGFFQKFFRKPEKSQKEQRLTVQRSIPYLEMGRDGICRVEEHLYSKTVRFYDINYQLAQNEDKNTIFESWCDFLNYFDARALLYWMSLNRKQVLFQYRYCNVKNLKIYLCQICRNSLKMYNDRAVRLLRKEC